MTKTLPLISILVCNYNYERYILECLTSAINQDYKDIEIVIVDDGSTDGSVAVIEKFIRNHASRNIRLSMKTKNKGICPTRNAAIDMAAGEYLVFLDSDDTIPPNYVKRLYETAIDKRADIVYSDVKYFGEQGGKSNAPDYDPAKLMLENYINIAALVKKSSIRDHRFDENLNHKSHEDYDFWIGLSLMGLKFVKAKDVYLGYRIQDKSRNSNTLDLKSRNLAFVDAWEYVVRKYRKSYPIPDDIFFAQLRYRIEQLSTELIKLNDVIQVELEPELQRREEHIVCLQRSVDEYRRRVDDGQQTIEQLAAQLNNAFISRDYRLGHWLLSPARKVKSVAIKPLNTKR